MSQFYQVFFEEAGELLAEMETLLLQLDPGAPGSEQLNAIFRAAHSIKGGASSFGFAEMTDVTHVLESLLDKVRKNELALTAEMVDVCLKAGDILKGQLAERRGDGAADPAAAAEVCAALKEFATSQAAPVPAVKPVPAAVAAMPAASGPQASGARYRIEFSLPGSLGANQALLNNVLADLRAKGTLEILSEPVDAEAMPACFVLRLATTASEEDIWESLAFVVDPAALEIEMLAHAEEGVPDQTTASGADAGPNPGYGLFEPLYNALVPPEGAVPAVATPLSSAPADGRRISDDPSVEIVKAGRRDTDKLAVSPGADASSIRVNIEKVDQLINLVGELVITQAMLAQTVSKVDPVAYEALVKGMNLLQRNTRDLQESVMSIRMMPIGFVFSRFPRVVRDLAGKLDKEVELKTVGEGTELDKGLIEKISDPLTHLVRNAIDHGIETPARRLAAGKPAKGTITLRAYHQGGNIVIEVSDDGAGLDRNRILDKARSRGMPVADTMSDQEVWQFIFEAGFSTAEVVTDVSGRGVGMDVVRRNIQALGGGVEIESALGAGTRMCIRLPLTLAILDGLSVLVGDEIFIIPLTYIVESLQPQPADIKSVHNEGLVIHVRGDYLPVVKAHELFNVRPKFADMQQGIIVILESEGSKKALLVDELLGQHQVVIKSLESNYRKVHGVSGATIMGDGRVALIIDAGAVVRGGRQKLLAA